MQRLIARFETAVRDLVNRRDHVALVVQASGPDAVLALKVIEGIDDQSADDLFFTFVEPFRDATTYVASVVERFATLHEMVRQKQREENVAP